MPELVLILKGECMACAFVKHNAVGTKNANLEGRAHAVRTLDPAIPSNSRRVLLTVRTGSFIGKANSETNPPHPLLDDSLNGVLGDIGDGCMRL